MSAKQVMVKLNSERSEFVVRAKVLIQKILERGKETRRGNPKLPG